MKLHSIAFTVDLDDDDHVAALLAVLLNGQDISQAAQEALETAGLDPLTLYAIQDGLLLTDYEEDGSSTVWRDKRLGQIIDETGKVFQFIVYPTQETPFTQMLRKLRSSSQDAP